MCMETMSKTPDNPVSELETQASKDRVCGDIERSHFAAVDVIADLPAKRSSWRQDSYYLTCGLFDEREVIPQSNALLVGLADVVRWRREDKLRSAIRYLCQRIQAIAMKQHGPISGVKSFGDADQLLHAIESAKKPAVDPAPRQRMSLPLYERLDCVGYVLFLGEDCVF